MPSDELAGSGRPGEGGDTRAAACCLGQPRALMELPPSLERLPAARSLRTLQRHWRPWSVCVCVHRCPAKPPHSFFIMADAGVSGVRGASGVGSGVSGVPGASRVGFTIDLKVLKLSNFNCSKARWVKARANWVRLKDEGPAVYPLAGDDKWRWTGQARA